MTVGQIFLRVPNLLAVIIIPTFLHTFIRISSTL